ncbi:MAG: 4-(cytidine 5'-diphospho)-2-C-methyl-D-erythritol kinase [Ruminococcaceae bacterium]|nr:4-(cytidine 5'-diphospho)-2-C-methyl-D-erythritol kinase [Oscillospiraceae bacterium]
MAALRVKANAKINLYLAVTGKRPNGYHDLVTVMQSVSLADTLSVERVGGEGISLDTGGVLPADDSNLVCRAAKAYFAKSGMPFGVCVKLEKQIPMQAGMGGGSADAAAMLRALNELDGRRFTEAELCEIAAGIGADVPFCVVGGTRLCRGIGEVMEPIENRLRGTLVVAIGGEGVSTPVAFGELDRKYRNFQEGGESAPDHLLPILAAMRSGILTEAKPHFYNMFEEVIQPIRPVVGEIKETMCDYGASAAMMSGSGPSVWGIFADASDAERAKAALLAAGHRAYVCEMVEEI